MSGPDDDQVFTEASVYGRLQTVLLSTADVGQVLTELAELVTATAAGDVSCGMTLRYDANLLTVGSSDERAEVLDESQYRRGAGPCLQAMAQQTIIAVPDFAVETRWPDYVPVAAEAGLRCSVSFPLAVAGESFGAMNVYGFDRPEMFDDAQRHQLELFSAQAAGALRVATRHAKDSRLLVQLEEALGSRTVIDQAMGIIIARHSCTAETAFELLRRESRNSRRRLRDIAHDLVVDATGGPADPGRPFHPS